MSFTLYLRGEPAGVESCFYSILGERAGSIRCCCPSEADRMADPQDGCSCIEPRYDLILMLTLPRLKDRGILGQSFQEAVRVACRRHSRPSTQILVRRFQSMDSSFNEPTYPSRFAPARIEVDSPEALLGSWPKVPTCPAVPNPKLRIFIAALWSRSNLQPH
jgi:hypothetical protein